MHCFYHLFGFEQVFQSIRRVEYDVPWFVTGDFNDLCISFQAIINEFALVGYYNDDTR